MIALLHLSLSFFPDDVSDSFKVGSSSLSCPFTLPLIHFPSLTHPEFAAFNIPPPAVAAASAAGDKQLLDCVHDISQGDRIPSIFICTEFSDHSSPLMAEQRIIPASSLAATAALASGLSLESPADDALQLLVQGGAVFDNLLSLKLNLWLVDGRYSPAVQQLLLFIAATHYLVRAAAVTANALVNCSAVESTRSHLPPTCMDLFYIHKRFVDPLPSQYSFSMLPFGRTNYSAAIESSGGHYFATLLHRHQPWIHMIPELSTDDSASDLIQVWSQRAALDGHLLQQQKLTYGRSAGNSESVYLQSIENDASVKSANLELEIMPLEEQLVMDRCDHAAEFLFLFATCKPNTQLVQVHRRLQ